MKADNAALLVVDDNEDNRYTLTRRLNREGYRNLSTANDGRAALDMLRAGKFDLVLLDIMMPELNGYEVLEQLKAHAQLRDIPVIMISALEEIDSVIRCVELGAEDYLSKPFNPTLLRARVGASLEKKRLRDAVRESLARLEQEIEGARKAQLNMLPSRFPAVSPQQPVQVHALMDPAREVGGDLYDAFCATEGLFCLLVGDVSGKGAAAGMFMARTRSLVRMAVAELLPRLAPHERTPAQIAEAVNRELCQDNRERMFVTLFLGFLDVRDGTLAYINAGHPLPYLRRSSGELEQVAGKPQAPLAVRAATRYQNQAVSLQPGDMLLVCTDGVVEAMNEAGELYGAARLEALLHATGGEPPQALVEALKCDIEAFTGGAPKADDVTLLALRLWPGCSTGLDAVGEPARAGEIELIIGNELAQMTRVSEAMDRLAAEHGLAPKLLVQLQVALDEMVSNVIKYAWPEGGSHTLQVRIVVDLSQVRIDICDDGRPFDPRESPAPQAMPAGPRPRPGGLGVHMVRQFIDRLAYERIDNTNRLTIIKLRRTDATQP
ncbi:SpoIIE family protein phosphatase [Rhodoferax sp.]|uniref:ATP-binding SpoIIE family protein phosphatase n=1 Tax=Rhodoferax sp. TaxID=50421 RepID=UPI0025FDD774|nr:SpoIIE family protein phosphatase [Rhodoferax sp.]